MSALELSAIGPGDCDCRANGCEQRIDVSVTRSQVRIEVHGFDELPDGAGSLARGVGALVRAIEEAAS